MGRLEVIPLPTAHHVTAGDDLAALVLEAAVEAGVTLTDGDVVCVASKVVSKSEGALVTLPDAVDVHAARRALAEQQAVRIVADTPWVLVVETAHGFVCANAGIDTSNLDGEGQALLLPADPDGAAAELRETIADRAGVAVGVIVTDTFGRPWRLGQTDVALGAAGITALRDERGTTDMSGRTLEVTLVAVADELAACADLARRKADGTPFVVIRGADVAGDGAAADLVRPAIEDTFRYGGATATEAAIFAPRTVPWHEDDAWDPTPAERAIVATAGPSFAAADHDPGRRWSRAVHDLTDEPPAGVSGDVVIGFYTDGAPERLVWVGRASERARLLLDAHSFTCTWHDDVQATSPWLDRSARTSEGGTVDVGVAGAGLRLVGVLGAVHQRAGSDAE